MTTKLRREERYIPDRDTFLAAYHAKQPIGAIVFHDDYYNRETAEWIVASFDDAAELFDALTGPGNSDLPYWHRITLDYCDEMGCSNVGTIRKES